MKKVLVIGAAGSLGIQTVKFLLSEGKYELTLLDLKNKSVFKKLKKYKKRANVLFGDVSDRTLMEALVKDQDFIIYLATALPPLANMKSGLAEAIDYGGVENVARALTYYNPKCHLFYASSTSVYKTLVNPSVKSKLELDKYDYFENAKIKAENLIKEKLKNYTIYRIPLLLTDVLTEPFIYTVPAMEMVDVITKKDCAYAFVKGISMASSINRKTFNLASEESILYKDLLKNIVDNTRYTPKMVLSRAFLEKDYYSPVCKDRDDLEKIISYRSDTLKEYYGRLRRCSRKIRRQK